jgi:LysR family glycine cleavage system transcriptional activator
MRKLPPLNALKAFEACARHKSFTAAARELCVTQSAVSRQVRILEDWFGTKLLQRSTIKLKPTPEGTRLASVIEEMFDDLVVATESLRNRPSEISVLVPPTFAVRWLLPRVEDFKRTHPDVQILVSTTDSQSIPHHLFDVGLVRIGHAQSVPGALEGIDPEAVVHEELVPVISPELHRTLGEISEPGDLFRSTLIHPNSKIDFWSAWLSINRVPGRPVREQIYEHTDVAIQATVRGQGITLVSPRLIDNEIGLGQLDLILKNAEPVVSNYCLVLPRSRSLNPMVSAFNEWLLTMLSQYWKVTQVSSQRSAPVAPIRPAQYPVSSRMALGITDGARRAD